MSHSNWLGQRTVRGLPATGIEKITTKKEVSIVEIQIPASQMRLALRRGQDEWGGLPACLGGHPAREP